MAGNAIKNKQVSTLQITAEQLLQEALERKEQPLVVPEQNIADLEELKEYQSNKRQEFEKYIRQNRLNTGQWKRYALFEVEQKEYDRARSVFERALDVDHVNVPLWVSYIQTEIKTRNINHARNLLDRVTTYLPRIDKFWFMYVSMEETLGNVDGARGVFDRWLAWEPQPSAFIAYISMEKRYGEYEKARNIFKRYIQVHPTVSTWLSWARFEDQYEGPNETRNVYELAIDTLMGFGEEYLNEKLLTAWAKWETDQKEFARSRQIYKLGLAKLPKDKSLNLYKSYTTFEKMFGDKEGIEEIVLSKRRTKYELKVKEDPYSYDTWFAFITLMEESNVTDDEVRSVYERAISFSPSFKTNEPSEKRNWSRYIFLWIRYAIWEELTIKNLDNSLKIYNRCLKLIPHKTFTFSKIWLLTSKLLIRQGKLKEARSLLGKSLGICPRPKLFKGYIDLEIKLKEFDRVRKLYEKFIETYPYIPNVWIDFANLESTLGDEDRARAIFELAIQQTNIEMPELVWKEYVDFEYNESNYDKARQLYEQMIERSHHVKAWITYALFEVSIPDEEQLENVSENEEEIEIIATEKGKQNAREIFKRAISYFKDKSDKESRILILQSWKEFEERYGDETTIENVNKQFPTVVKKKRKLDESSMEEEYLDYVFPDDENDKSFVKFFENAKKWKEQQKEQQKQSA